MMTVNEVSRITGLSIRTLQYYDRIGLLPAAGYTEAGYRLYDESSLERLQQIMLFRELEFSLADIARMLDSPGFDRKLALKQQKELLLLKKDNIEKLIELTDRLQKEGRDTMDFDAFDRNREKEYAKKAKQYWGQTDAYREYEKKSAGRSEKDQKDIAEGLMDIFSEFAGIRDKGASSDEAVALVRKLQGYITENYYTCTDEILSGLGAAYGSGGEFTRNIDASAGEGTGAFAAEAIRRYLEK